MFLTWKKVQDLKPIAQVQFFSIEKYPLPFELIKEVLDKEAGLHGFANEFLSFYKTISAGYNQFSAADGKLELVLIVADVAEIINSFHAKIDVWYLDGFSPAKNPEMWSKENFSFMKKNSKKGASFSTYTTAGFVREGLTEVGFLVEKFPGFGNKKYMLKGKLPIIRQTISDKPWFRIPKNNFKSKRAVVIGAGLAGTSLVFALSQKGFSITLVERESEISSGASGNPAGMFAPLLTGDTSDLGEWNIAAYKEFTQFLDKYSKRFPEIFRNAGVFQVTSSSEEFNKLQKAFTNSKLESNDAFFLEKNNDILNGYQGIFFPKAGWVSPVLLSQAYIKLSEPNIKQILSTTLTSLKWENSCWKILLSNNKVLESEIVIFANSFETQNFVEVLLDVKKVRGQILYFPSKKFSTQLKNVILHEDGYIIPDVNGFHIVGATFDPTDPSEILKKEHNIYLLQKLKNIFPEINPEDGLNLEGRVSFRAMSKDHLPIVGAVPNLQAFQNEYSDLWKSNIYKDYRDGQYEPGLFVSTAHGSRGILNSYLAANVISSMITGGPLTIHSELLEKINPSRFLIQSFTKYRKVNS